MSLEWSIDPSTPAGGLVAEGLEAVSPVLDELGSGALLIGGLITAAWLDSRPVGIPARATVDIDLGIDRLALGLTGRRERIVRLLAEHGFTKGFGGEDFRFVRDTSAGPFVVDLLLPAGASRSRPPLIEPGLSSLSAPGLRYAITRGPVPVELRVLGRPTRSFRLHGISLEAAFVMKATLVADRLRTRRDKLVADTADAVMLARACASDPGAMAAMAADRRFSEPRRAINWLMSEFVTPRSRGARRMAEHVGGDHGAEWAVNAAREFESALTMADSSRRGG